MPCPCGDAHPGAMRIGIASRPMNDTTPAADNLRMELLRSMTPARRLALATGWSSSLRAMVQAKLRQELPRATEAERLRLFASRWLGEELAAKAYGPRAPGDHG